MSNRPARTLTDALVAVGTGSLVIALLVRFAAVASVDASVLTGPLLVAAVAVVAAAFGYRSKRPGALSPWSVSFLFGVGLVAVGYAVVLAIRGPLRSLPDWPLGATAAAGAIGAVFYWLRNGEETGPRTDRGRPKDSDLR